MGFDGEKASLSLFLTSILHALDSRLSIEGGETPYSFATCGIYTILLSIFIQDYKISNPSTLPNQSINHIIQKSPSIQPNVTLLLLILLLPSPPESHDP